MPISRIIVGNDQPDMVELCQMVLEVAGHTVRTVTDGLKAVALARGWKPDLLVLDWMMPNLDGIGAVGVLRNDAQTRCIPILMMSGSDGAQEVAMRAGADSFLAKPFGADDLLHSVARVLELRNGSSTSRG
jgi:two-component system OmpR family response regulator